MPRQKQYQQQWSSKQRIHFVMKRDKSLHLIDISIMTNDLKYLDCHFNQMSHWKFNMPPEFRWHETKRTSHTIRSSHIIITWHFSNKTRSSSPNNIYLNKHPFTLTHQIVKPGIDSTHWHTGHEGFCGGYHEANGSRVQIHSCGWSEDIVVSVVSFVQSSY